MSVAAVGAMGVGARAGYAQVEPEMDYSEFQELAIENLRFSMMPRMTGS